MGSNINTWHNWESWRDIKDWAKEQGFENIVKRLDLNNACWNSSGEFGKPQKQICDMLRFTTNEDEAIGVADEIDMALNYDPLLECIA